MKTTRKMALLLAIIMLFSAMLCSCGTSTGGTYKSSSESKSGGGMKDAVENPYKLYATKNVSYDKYIEASTNGYLASEMKGILKILSKADDYEDIYDDFEEDWEDQYEDLVDDYGKNLKVTLKLEEKEEIKSKDLKSYQENFRNYGDTLKNYVEDYKDLDKDDIKDMAEDLGITKSDLDKAVDYLEKIATALRKCEVTEGYELDYTITIKGSEDEDEYDNTFVVVKVNGHWVNTTLFEAALREIAYYVRYATR